MSIARWFPKSIAQTHVVSGFTIVLTTDIPCHLTLFWTDKEPWVHPITGIQRGLAVPWDAYWCYVAWHLIPQNEAGDTLIHTYNWLGWVVCQTKWFRFHGTIAGETSPSDSPIYRKHYELYVATYFMDYPPLEPKQPWGAFRWAASPFVSLQSGTPSKIKIWWYRTYWVNYNIEFYVEDSYLWLPAGWRPYDNQTGHIKCHVTIPKAVVNSYLDQWHLYDVAFSETAPLTLGQHYAVVVWGTAPDNKALDGPYSVGSYVFWRSNTSNPAARSFLYFPYWNLMSARVE